MVMNIGMAFYCFYHACRPTLPTSAATLLSGCLVVGWLLTGHWLLLDLLAFGLGVFMISMLQLPNLRVCTLLLSAYRMVPPS